MTLVRLLLLCFSLFGYVLFLYKRCRINAAFTPAITVSVVLLTVYLAGLLGILAWSVYLLLAVGIALLIWMLLSKKPTGWKQLLTSPALIVLSVFGIYFFFRFHNRVLYSYDDFSHWGLVVQTMLRVNSLPTAANSFLMFQSYPPGSACWIYFVSRVLGAKEGVFLFAQAMLTLSYLVALFAPLGKRRWYDLVLPLVGVVLIYTNVLDPNCMGVDVLLPASGIAAVWMIYFYRDSLTKHAVWIVPLVCAPLLFKNSGFYFSLLACGLFLVYLFASKKEVSRKRWIATVAVLVIPLACLLLWRQHVAVAFADGLGTKHALSMENFLANWQNNRAYALEMLQKIGSWLINPGMNRTLIVLGGLVALAVVEAVLVRDKQTNARNLEILLMLVLATVLYEIGEALMYLFSMPFAEFSYQNGGDYLRYNSSMVDFLFGVSLLWCGKKLAYYADKAEKKPVVYGWVLRAGMLVLLLVCLIPGTQIQTLSPSYHTELETQVEQIHTVLDEKGFASGGKYYLKTDDDKLDLAGFMFSYLLFTDKLEATSDSVDSDEIPEIVSEYDAYLSWNANEFKVYTADSFAE